MTTYYVNNANREPWLPNTVYSVGTKVMAKFSQTGTAKRSNIYECTTAGTSHATTEPNWSSLNGATVADGPNTLVWTTRYPTSWDNANGSLLMLASGSVLGNGDIVLVHKTHSEDIGATDGVSTLDLGGSITAPNFIVCVDKDNSDVLSTGAVVVCGVTKNIGATYSVSAFVINIKLIFNVNLGLQLDGSLTMLGIGSDLTLLQLAGATSIITGVTQTEVTFNFTILNANVQMDFAANYLLPSPFFTWKGGRLIAANGTTFLINLANKTRIQCIIEISDVDLSAVGANTLFNITSAAKQVNATLTRCKLPTDLSAISNAWANLGHLGAIKLHHCSYAKKTYGFTESSNEGDVSEEISIVRTGGATDGITPISWKMVSSSRALSPYPRLESPSINLWNASTSEITLTVHGIVDSATNLQDDEVWIEVEYPADATSGLGTLVTTVKIAVCETPADLTASTETWAESMANPNKFKLAATFTPAQAGPIAARVCVGKASTTIYVCPKAVIS